jgi:serine/threonine protein kinase
VSTLGVVEPAKPEKDELIPETYSLVLEFMEGGDLSQWIRHHGPLKNCSSFTAADPVEATANRLRQILSVALGVSRGVNCLHHADPKIIHRDLKPANILLSSSSSGDEAPLPKITDFNVSRQKDEGTANMTRVGTPHFMAPEVIKGEKYNESVDVYSLGMLIWQMTSGQTPFAHKLGAEADNNAFAVLLCVAQKERPELVRLEDCLASNDSSAEYRRLKCCLDDTNALIERCWAHEAADRDDCDAVVEELARILLILEEDPDEALRTQMLEKTTVTAVTTVTLPTVPFVDPNEHLERAAEDS